MNNVDAVNDVDQEIIKIAKETYQKLIFDIKHFIESMIILMLLALNMDVRHIE